MDYLVCVYLVRIDNYYRAFMTHDPGVDAEFYFGQQAGPLPGEVSGGAGKEYMDVLTPLLPVGVADYVLKSVFSEEERRGQLISPPGIQGETPVRDSWRGLFSALYKQPCTFEAILSQKNRKIKAVLEQIAHVLEDNLLLNCYKNYPVRITPDSLKVTEARQPDAGEAVLKALGGRILFYRELEKSLLEHQTDTNHDSLNALQVLALSGKVEIIPSLGFTSPGEIVCHRCGNTASLRAGLNSSALRADLFYETTCPTCSFKVICCEQCSNLGGSRLCKGLFAAEQKQIEVVDPAEAPVIVKRRGVPSLTPAQTRAACEIKAFVTDPTVCECLLWAVCGAGKTEVILEAVQKTLSSGGQVLYASPRRDVVIEIAPRLERSFEGVKVNAVYGGSPVKFGPAGFTAATAHQAVRFYRMFDLVIMDEVDAYPYKDNKMLHMAVKRAVKPNGRIIYLTATPSRELLTQADKGKIGLVTIPARFHGYPVPVPDFLKGSPFVKKGRGETAVEPRVKEILRKWVVELKGQVFVFLPTVKMVQTYETVLEKAVWEITGGTEPGFVSFSYARDSLRDYKRECFKQGITRVFVTTSIMERGITVANAHVMVLNSDMEFIFDEGTLIQMSGRAGRAAEYPDGGVVFVGRRVTGAMKGAREKIKRLNNEARKQGYLNPGW